MTNNSPADRDDQLATAMVTLVVFTGGILSLVLLGAVAMNVIA
jgi:hypothetical protein